MIVIRSVGERTTGNCRRIIAHEFPHDRIEVVSVAPFRRAVQRTYEIGLARGFRWTVAVDADVLVAEGAIARLVAAAERANAKMFELQGRFVDKLFQGVRSGGIHLYRTSLLDQALTLARMPDTVHRPEFSVIRKMTQAGYFQQSVDTLIGLHDFEQSYRDLYRKGFVHAQKHAEELNFLEPMWRRLARRDADYRAVLLGMESGRRAGGVAQTDVRVFEASIDTDLAACGLREKPPLGETVYTSRHVAEIIRQFEAAPEFQSWTRSLRRRQISLRARRAIRGLAARCLRRSTVH